MSEWQIILLILILAFGVWLTRFLPFIVFKKGTKIPKTVEYLGRVLPAAMMGLLVVYCVKDYNFSAVNDLVPLLLSVAAVVGVHLYKRNTIVSITVGTVLYMVLIRIM